MGDYSDLITSEIMENAVKEYGDINLLKLSEFCGTTNTGLKLALSGKRKWNAELWLTVLSALGAVKVSKNKIIIQADETVSIEDIIRSTSKEDYGEKRRWYV